MLTSRELILGTEKSPLIVLDKYELNIDEKKIILSKKELKKQIENMNDSSKTWGYFPQIKQDKNLFQKTISLANFLNKNFILKLEEGKDFQLAFIRLATGKPISDFGGLHIDVDTGINHKRDISNKKEIARLLLNLDDKPRTLEYTKENRFELKKLGLNISESKYDVINLPENIEIKKIEIPSREKNFVYTLKFWSSLIPHFGLTDEKGHFLAAYGMYADFKTYKL